MKTFAVEPSLQVAVSSVASSLTAGSFDRPGTLGVLIDAVRDWALRDQELRRFALELRAAVGHGSGSDGFALVDLMPVMDGPVDRLFFATAVCALVGRPFRTITGSPLWKLATVDLDREPHAFGGSGLLPLHIDHVNATVPPDWTALLCLRPDPKGGGQTILADLQAAAEGLSPEEIDELARPAFVEGRFYGLEGLGTELNPFPVLSRADDGQWRVRYTGKLLYDLPEGRARMALLRLTDLLQQTQQTVMLSSGQLLIMNQRRVAHGRLPLGPGQEGVPADVRRLCRQGHIRADLPPPVVG